MTCATTEEDEELAHLRKRFSELHANAIAAGDEELSDQSAVGPSSGDAVEPASQPHTSAVQQPRRASHEHSDKFRHPEPTELSQ